MVGFVAVIGDRLAGYEIFGSASLFRSHWSRLLRGYVFAAAGHEIRTGLAGVPLPRMRGIGGAAGPDRHDRAIRQFRKQISGAVYRTGKADGGVTHVSVKRSGLVGEALISAADGLIHLEVFPYSAYDDRIYDRRVPPEGGEDVDLVVLQRKKADGERLSKYEQRYLDRLEKRRRDGNPSKGGSLGTPKPADGPELPSKPKPRVKPGPLPEPKPDDPTPPAGGGR